MAYLFVLPALVIFGVFTIAPTIFTFVISTYKWNYLNAALSRFVGAGNYRSMVDGSSEPSFASTMAVSFDPDNGTADYSASSVIPLLTASFTDRATQMFGNVKLTDLSKIIGLAFNTSGGTPEITYDADSRLGSIEANYS